MLTSTIYQCYHRQKGDNIMGKISDDKTRYLMLIEKDLKLELEVLAKEENRSLNNLITKILSDYIKDRK